MLSPEHAASPLGRGRLGSGLSGKVVMLLPNEKKKARQIELPPDVGPDDRVDAERAAHQPDEQGSDALQTSLTIGPTAPPCQDYSEQADKREKVALCSALK